MFKKKEKKQKPVKPVTWETIAGGVFMGMVMYRAFFVMFDVVYG